MGNCVESTDQNRNEHNFAPPESTNQRVEQAQQPQFSRDIHQASFPHTSNYYSAEPEQHKEVHPNPSNPYQFSSSKKESKIDFENLGRKFLFFDEAKKLVHDQPWQRDEGNSSNRPNQISFGLNNLRQPIANGLATQENPQFELSSLDKASPMMALNMSMNRTEDKGYPASMLSTNRKKQNIFYDGSTYNQNPYAKTTSPIKPFHSQVDQSSILRGTQITQSNFITHH